MMRVTVGTLAVAVAVAAQPRTSWDICPGTLELYSCAGCQCQGQEANIGESCSLVESQGGTATYGFIASASDAAHHVAICGSTSLTVCNSALEQVRRNHTLPAASATFGCFGSQLDIPKSQCKTEVESTGTFSIDVQPHCPPVPAPTTPSHHCEDVSPNQIQTLVERYCQTHNRSDLCDVQNCDELVATLQHDGTSCSQVPQLNQLCCASCAHPGSGNDTRTCTQNLMECELPVIQMYSSQCCPAIVPPLSSAKFQNSTVEAECEQCAQRLFGSKYHTCSCCIPPLIHQITASSGIEIPEAWTTTVFGSCNGVEAEFDMKAALLRLSKSNFRKSS